MSSVIECTTEETYAEGVRVAAAAVRRGELVVVPTDTVYGIGADAFDPAAVRALLEAKGRGRDMPPPVLVPNKRTIDGLATAVPTYARRLAERYWPGPLTLVLRAQASLLWDLGDTNGTVAVRMPDDELTLSLLAETGPLAVSSANASGRPAATTVGQARHQLGEAVAVYLDGGPSRGGQASTIVDCTTDDLIVLREGAIDEAELRAVAEPPEADPSPESPQAPATSTTGPTSAGPTAPAGFTETRPQDVLSSEQTTRPDPLTG